VPVYGKRCIICGLTVEQAGPQQGSGNVAIQGWWVLLGVVFLLVLIWRW
jgi:hypothetical protein